MIGIVTNIYRDGDPRRPDGDPPRPCLYVTVGGNRDDPDPAQRSTVDLVATYSGEPPPPLSVCRFTDDLMPHCLGTLEVHVEEIFRDHFMYVTGTEPDLGDTSWNSTIAGGGVGADAGVQITDAEIGVARIQSRDAAGASTTISKDQGALSPAAADAFWMQTKVRIPTVTSVSVYVGFDNTGNSDCVQCWYHTGFGTQWFLRTNADSGATTLTGTGTDPVDASTFYTADLMFVPGEFAALWIDGDGPYHTTELIPTTGDTLTPTYGVASLAAATRRLDVDLIAVWGIRGPLANPETHELLTL